jgi:hypothetical protein
VPSSPQPVADLLGELQRVFSRLELRWFLFGAQAAILYGVARLSAAVDVTVDTGERSARELVDALAAAGFDLRVADVEEFVAKTRVLPFVHRRSRIPVDVVLAGPGLEEQFLAGAQPRQVGQAIVPVASPEELIAMKILAGRPRDLDDVAAIVQVRGGASTCSACGARCGCWEGALDRRDLETELERILRSAPDR